MDISNSKVTYDLTNVIGDTVPIAAIFDEKLHLIAIRCALLKFTIEDKRAYIDTRSIVWNTDNTCRAVLLDIPYNLLLQAKSSIADSNAHFFTFSQDKLCLSYTTYPVTNGIALPGVYMDNTLVDNSENPEILLSYAPLYNVILSNNISNTSPEYAIYYKDIDCTEYFITCNPLGNLAFHKYDNSLHPKLGCHPRKGIIYSYDKALSSSFISPITSELSETYSQIYLVPIVAGLDVKSTGNKHIFGTASTTDSLFSVYAVCNFNAEETPLLVSYPYIPLYLGIHNVSRFLAQSDVIDITCDGIHPNIISEQSVLWDCNITYTKPKDTINLRCLNNCVVTIFDLTELKAINILASNVRMKLDKGIPGQMLYIRQKAPDYEIPVPRLNSNELSLTFDNLFGYSSLYTINLDCPDVNVFALNSTKTFIRYSGIVKNLCLSNYSMLLTDFPNLIVNDTCDLCYMQYASDIDLSIKSCSLLKIPFIFLKADKLSMHGKILRVEIMQGADFQDKGDWLHNCSLVSIHLAAYSEKTPKIEGTKANKIAFVKAVRYLASIAVTHCNAVTVVPSDCLANWLISYYINLLNYLSFDDKSISSADDDLAKLLSGGHFWSRIPAAQKLNKSVIQDAILAISDRK